MIALMIEQPPTSQMQSRARPQRAAHDIRPRVPFGGHPVVQGDQLWPSATLYRSTSTSATGRKWYCNGLGGTKWTIKAKVARLESRRAVRAKPSPKDAAQDPCERSIPAKRRDAQPLVWGEAPRPADTAPQPLRESFVAGLRPPPSPPSAPPFRGRTKDAKITSTRRRPSRRLAASEVVQVGCRAGGVGRSRRACAERNPGPEIKIANPPTIPASTTVG